MANEEHVKRITELYAWLDHLMEFLDLSGASLSGADLTGFNLYQIDLEGANLRAADLRGAAKTSGLGLA